VASPIVGKMGTLNTGSLQLSSLVARDNPPTNVPVTIQFTGTNQYIRSDDPNYANYPATLPLPALYTYTSGTPIEGSVPATAPLSQWSLVLQGSPKAGDTFTVVGINDTSIDPLTNQPYNNNVDYTLNSGNAGAMVALRDLAMFDGSAMTDGYASMISQIGIRAQSANYSAEVSSSIAANLETDRTGVSGVNLDEEAAKLLQYQQAYQASAKVVQVAQGIFDTLIQTISR